MPSEFHLSGGAWQWTRDSDDPDTAPDLAALDGVSIEFVCNIPANKPLPIAGGIMFVGRRTATITADGQIVDEQGNPGIDLIGDDPDFELESHVQWRVKVGTFTDSAGRTIRPIAYWVNAPAPGVSVTIDELTPVPGVEQPGGTRGLRGYSIDDAELDGNELVLFIRGIEVGRVNIGTLIGGSALPTQTGQTGKFLTTDGDTPQWAAADVTDAATVGTSVAGVPAKTTPAAGDSLALLDSASSNVLRRLTWANLVTAITALIVDAAPGMLDTLKEIAAAIENDPNFSVTMTDLIGTKVDKSSTINSVYVTDSAGNTIMQLRSSSAAANTLAIRGAGGTLAVGTATAADHAVTKAQLEALSTIPGFAEAVQDAVAALLVAGSNVTLNYNDTANTLTIAATGGGGSGGASNWGELGGTLSNQTDLQAALDALSAADAALSAATADALATKAPTARTITAGTGLTGGGDLSVNRTLAVSYGTTAGTAAQGNDSRLSNQRRFPLTQSAERTASFTAVANQQERINATTNLTATMPAAPADGDLESFYIVAGTANVTLAANSGQELRFDGSTQTSLALQGSGGTIGLSLWRYQAAGAVWVPLSWTILPASTDIVDSSGPGRAVLTGDAATGRAALGAASATIAANTQTGTAYTLVLADAGKAVEMNNAAANTVTVPPNSTAAFAVGDVIELCQYGAGQTTVVAGSGVTIRSSAGKLKLAGQYSAASLRKRGTNEWVLAGDVVA